MRAHVQALFERGRGIGCGINYSSDVQVVTHRCKSARLRGRIRSLGLAIVGVWFVESVKRTAYHFRQVCINRVKLLKK